MAKAKTKTKTWKIGEYCKGGVITVEITGKVIHVIGKDWDMSAGSNRGSNQSNAKEFIRETVKSNEDNAYHKLYEFLTDLTTHYYAEEVIKWIEGQVELKTEFF